MIGPRSIATNLASMMTLRLVQQALPLVTLPYLLRVLGVDGYGLVAIAMAFAGFHQLLFEYGFELSASRAIARSRDDRDNVERIVAETLTAKALLWLVGTAGAVALAWAVPTLRQHPALFAGAIALSTSSGASLGWYFQGLERLERLASIEIVGRIAAAASIFLFVRDADAYWLVPWVQSGPVLLAALVSLLVASRWHRIRLAAPRRGLRALRVAWRLFAFRSSSALYTQANTAILALIVEPASVGLYAVAEKLVRAALRLATPVAQVMLPRQSTLVHKDRVAAERLARRTFFVMVGGAALGAMMLTLLREWVLRLVFGADLAAAGPLLATLAVMLPFVAGSNVVGVQWMLPLGLDRPFLRIIVIVGIANIAIAPAAGFVAGALGVAWTAVAAEAAVLVAMLIVLTRHGANPFGARGAGAP